MVLGAINANFQSPLVVINGNLNARGYVDQVLHPHLLPLLTQHGGNARFLFQQDNARLHTARHTRNFLQQHGVHVMQWPALSPDMNCIEHLWDVLGRLVEEQRPRPRNRQELIATLLQAWQQIPMATIRRLTMSMPARLWACIVANGGHTRYLHSQDIGDSTFLANRLKYGCPYKLICAHRCIVVFSIFFDLTCVKRTEFQLFSKKIKFK